MAKKKGYSLKELAGMLEPGQLGMQGNETMFLYHPVDTGDPRIKALLEISGWREVKGVEWVLQAAPTLENWYALDDFGFKHIATPKVMNWHYFATNTLSVEEYSEWMKHDTLFDYQKDGARFLTIHDRAMLSLSPGLGKTLTSAYAAGIRAFHRVLVVCPASLLYYWKGELEKWQDKLPIKPIPVVWHKEVGKNIPEDIEDTDTQFWAITNPETVHKHLDRFLSDLSFDCLIADESIMYKHRDSNRSKSIKTLAQSIDTTWLLTGAPATRYLDDMWHQFHILKPKGYSSYWRFARKYCIVDDTDWGSKVVANQVKAEEEIKKNFKDIYFSRTQDDVLNIPDWIMEDIDIPMLPAQDKAYETLRKELRIKLDTVDPNEYVKVNNHLSLMIRSVQVASNPLLVEAVYSSGKWDALPDLMNYYPGPYIIWVNFIKTGEILRDKLNGVKIRDRDTTVAPRRVALANGSTPMEDRNKLVNSFQNGELDAIILNNQVGKFGFNLVRARTAFFVERMYDDSYYQCLHRNRRIGTTQSPVIVNMRSITQNGKKTIDHLVHSALDYRNGMIKKVTVADLQKTFSE